MDNVSESGAEEWVSAHESILLACQRFDDLRLAEEKLSLLIRVNDIEVAADLIAHCWDIGELDWRPPQRWSGNPKILIASDLPENEHGLVRPSIWWASTATDPERWDWTRGNFVLSGVEAHDGRPIRVQIWNARLRRDQLDRELSKIPMTSKAAAQVARDTLRKYDFEPALIDLLMICIFDGFEDTFGIEDRGGQAKLERWFAEWFSDRKLEEPSEANCRRHAASIARAYREAKATRVAEGS